MKRKDEVVHEEARELRWPDGQPRTRIQDRERRSAWKQPMPKVREMLRTELERSGATASLVTYSTNPLDPGVAVYFSREATNQFAWQEALGLIGKIPTVDEINRAYQQAARRCHPDGPTPDLELFRSLTEHRNRAVDWATGKHRTDHEYVIAIDVFDEARLNLNAVKVVLYSLRRIEDCGSPLMLERAFRGFSKQITAGGIHDSKTVA
jgi:hypothetical protein